MGPGSCSSPISESTESHKQQTREKAVSTNPTKKPKTKSNYNLYVVYLHLLWDCVGVIVIVVAGLVIRFTGFLQADAIGAIVLSVAVIYTSIPAVKDTVQVLMQSAPNHLNLDELEASIQAIPRVVQVRELHVWQLTFGETIASVHVKVQECDSHTLCCAEIRDCVSKFGIENITIQSDIHLDS